MTGYKDDWPKRRSHGQHFTDDELALIAKRFREGAKVHDVARELLCSSRNISIRYAQLRGGDTPRSRVAKKAERPKRPPANREARMYRSNFEPT